MPPAGPDGFRAHHGRGLVPTVVGLLVGTCGWSVLWLVAWLVVPVLATSWQPLVVTSGSMAPGIRPGDVVFVDPDRRAVDPGQVVTFEHPTTAGLLVTHRTRRQLEDGRWITAGDANDSDDSTPVAPDQIVGVARLLVPGVGLPLHWLTTTRAAYVTTTPVGGNSWTAATVAPATSLSATPGCALTLPRVVLSWTPPGAGPATGQQVRRAATAAGPFTTVATLPSASTATWTDTAVLPSTTYHYRIRTTTASSWSATSATASATTRGPLCL